MAIKALYFGALNAIILRQIQVWVRFLMIDSFDRGILAILQTDNSTPLRLISQKVNLSAPAIQRRIKRMQESGIIVANVAVLDPARIGQSITIIVEVELVSETSGLIDDIKHVFSNEPEVQQCYYVTGEADFVLVIAVASMAEYEALTRRLFLGNGNVKKFKTLVAMDRVKTGLAYRV